MKFLADKKDHLFIISILLISIVGWQAETAGAGDDKVIGASFIQRLTDGITADLRMLTY